MNYSRLYKNLIFSFVFATTTVVVAQSRQEKRKKESIEQLQKHIKYLASDELEGRQTGSPGEQLSASYIANEFKKNGLTLLGDNGFQKFTMTHSVGLPCPFLGPRAPSSVSLGSFSCNNKNIIWI